MKGKKMKNKFYLSLLILAIFLMGFLQQDSDIFFKINKSIDIFGNVFQEITLNYVDPVDPEQFMLAGIKGMLSSLDPYTVFINENKQKDVEAITSGKYGGIGATVGLSNGRATIIDLFEGYPAQRQGLRIGDVILKVDSITITKENYPGLGNYLKRKPGSEIKLTILRDGEDAPLIFNIITEEIHIKNVPFFSFVPGDSSIVYLKLSGFTRNAGEEVKDALLKLKKIRDYQGIILDLRGNPGGLLDAAIDVSEKFLAQNKLIVSIKGRDPSSYKKFVSREVPVAGKRKLVVLINGSSASASEIVAGAIQDHDRGVILGEKSFGKGLVQTIVPLSYKTSLKLTTARYFTPSGRCIQKLDYSNNKKLFPRARKLISRQYRTEHHRIVYSAGGIQPDTVVANARNAEIVKELLAQGYFFKFATHYFNKHPRLKLNKLNSNKLFNLFRKYLEAQKFQFHSKAVRRLVELKKYFEKEKFLRNFTGRLEKLKDEITSARQRALELNKKTILIEIFKELAARVDGRKGRIIESLKFDRQFTTAIKILERPEIYERLLNEQ